MSVWVGGSMYKAPQPLRNMVIGDAHLARAEYSDVGPLELHQRPGVLVHPKHGQLGILVVRELDLVEDAR